MGASGTVIVDFGAFPGQSDASVTVAAPGIAADSLVEAWILPATTTDHSPDEHVVESLTVKADQSSIVVNTSFVIRVANTSQLDEGPIFGGAQGAVPGGTGTRIYGKWNLGWVWD
jgi:L-fucose mutarotase/ribose pyranase (RbsD/FucU family)